MTKKISIQQLIKELDLSIEDLPGALAELARKLDKHVPGRGLELTLKLGTEYRGTYVYFHNFDELERRFRDRWLIDQYGKGTKVPLLARAVRLSERQVWSILGKSPEEERQRRLF